MKKRRKTNAHKAVKVAEQQEKKPTTRGKLKESLRDRDEKVSVAGRNPVPADLVAMVAVRNGMQDDFPMSQAEGSCDVGWDSNSPITMTQVSRINHGAGGVGDLQDLVKKCMDEGSALPSCTPPLLGLWMESPGESGRDSSSPKNITNKCRRRGKRGRPTGIKAAISSKELLMRLQSVIESGSSEEKEISEKQNRSSPEDASVHEDMTTHCMVDNPKSGESYDLFNSADKENGVQLAEVKRDLNIEMSSDKPGSGLKSSLVVSSAQSILQSLEGSKLKKTCVLASPLLTTVQHIEPATSALCSNSNKVVTGLHQTDPISQDGSINKSQNVSCQDLWTDDELFDDDSFIIKATQNINNAPFQSPRVLKHEGRTSTPTTNKKGRYTFSLDRSPIPVANITNTAGIVPPASYMQSTVIGNSTSSATFKMPQNQPQKPVPVKSYYTRYNSFARNSKLTAPQPSLEDINLSQCSQIVGSSQMHVKQFPNKGIKTAGIIPNANPIRPPVCHNVMRSSVQKSHSILPRNTLPSGALNSTKPGVFQPPNKVNTRSYGTGFTVTKPAASSKKVVSSTTGAMGRLASNKPSVAGVKPLKVNSNTHPTVSHANSTNFSAPARIPPFSKLVENVKEATVINTSITDDILASLAEPDDILDSQVATEAMDIEDDEDLWVDMAIIPPTSVPSTNTRMDGKPINININPPVESTSLGTQVPGVVGSAVTEKQSNSDGKSLSDTFLSDDDGLCEPQLLALLEEAEIKASQISSSQSSKEPTMPTSTTSNQPVKNEHPFNDNNCPHSQESTCTTSPLSSTAGSVIFPRRSSTELFTGSQGSSKSKSTSVGSTSSSIDGGARPSSQESSTKYSIEDIERKKTQALMRRQNKLKLSRRK